ncbi:pyridoxal-dependent decarboxylase [Streptomyces sp. NBC_01433]|uniref:pyridoxal-dependent decarboxylase n=1 Tax=Streptomyces sp. NBC_01433 TaxID=2903864 RepID=UPI002259F9BC|nr:pyridoxal-dependent decarboxylase [Streptomyces sp. NBC_01433]MCX4681347.1 pyridoxal-dependent decarboxylase [Streptomyces sp. NBC_01433]MCX4681715.1 pyridoxal-dependent decarboxylase [Streptomyces sp. NBC_01433]MCX4682423.1 pyridoxal-dependent decarboxylase [Streptomyces sp. NBC_01433]
MSPRTAPNLPDEGLAIGFQPSPPAADTRKLHRLYRALDRDERPFLSFPGHLGQVMAELAPLLGMFVDQRRGPYSPTVFDTGTGEYEKAVLTYFAALAGASPQEAHGFVTASPREALLHGLVMARRGLPEPSVYVSEQAHFDVVRACELLGMNTVRVNALPDDTMDPDDLLLQTRMRRGAGALVVATCGTPLRGAIDNVAELRAAAAVSGPVRVHVDASAGGLMAAHSNQVPPWSLAHGAHSITLSGHRLLGLPAPAGISLVRREQDPSSGALGIRMPDRLVVGSRSGLSALLLWTRLRSLGRAGVAAMIARCQDAAAYAVEQFEAAGASPERFPDSLTITFDRPPNWVADKWRLECFGDLARISTTGPMTHTTVDELATDLSAARLGAVA